MSERRKSFHEPVWHDGDDEFISSHCSVECDSEGYFITVETDSYEGSAMFTLPVARGVYEALGRAINHAEEMRRIGKAQQAAKLAKQGSKRAMIEVQTDETCYRLVDDNGNESAVVEYGQPCIIATEDGYHYCMIEEPDDTPQVFCVDKGSPVDSRHTEVSGLDDDEEDDDDSDDDDDPDGGEEVEEDVERVA